MPTSARKLEPSEQPLQPALVRRLGVLGEQRHVLPVRLAHQQVARAAVAEALGRDLEHARPMRARELDRAVARARVAHQQLVLDALAGERLQRAGQQRPPVAHRDRDGHVHRRTTSTQSASRPHSERQRDSASVLTRSGA